MVGVIVRVACLSLSLFFAFLCFQVVDDALRRQLAALAASLLLIGMVILTSLVVYLRVKAS
jgi:TRAP-type C4-dicarboxylate transport system permease small subunit